MWRWLAVALAIWCAQTAVVHADAFQQAVDEARTAYGERLEELARWCDAQGLSQEAGRTRDWIPRRDPNLITVPALPAETDVLAAPAGLPPDVAEWHGRFTALRQTQAREFYALSRRAIRAGRPSAAMGLLLAAARENPDDAGIRRALGQQSFRGQWCTPYELRRRRAGYVWDARFGWLPEAHLPRYERGERLVGNRWVPADEEARLRRDIRRGWVVETEHFSIRTNHSLEAGAALAADLEAFYRVWQQLFIGFRTSPAEIMARLDGRARARTAEPPRHQVVLFRDHDDYVAALRPTFGNVEQSVGMYWDTARRAYFFVGEEEQRRTTFHEATHQLFAEARPAVRGVGQGGNFWIVEGIALYMESFREENGFWVLGGFDDLRMRAARYRLLEDDFYVPLAELVTYTAADVQGDPRIATLYSQFAGLTHFLIHGDGGRYREALVEYLSAVYGGRDTSETLAQLTGTPYDELDRQYREYMARGTATAATE